MKDLRTLSDSSLISETKLLVQEERRVSLLVLYHLKEIDRRRLYAGLGYSSLYEYATRELGYSEASAQRRIQSARLLSECPDLAPQIESGSLSLSVLSQAQTFFRKEEIRDPEAKREILKTLENESSRGAERKLLSLSTEPAKHLPEKVRPVSEDHSEVRLTVDTKFLEQLEELKGLLSEPSLKATIAYALKVALEKKRPKAPKSVSAERAVARSSSHAAQSRPVEIPPTSEVTRAELRRPSRKIPIETKRIVWSRDQGQCTYRDPNFRRCGSRFGLELDHLKPFALGGSNLPDNLVLKCKAHNTWSAIRTFGHDRMARFVPSLR